MLLCDLHFHANVPLTYNGRHRRRIVRAAQGFKAHGLDYVASTEHAYKNPLNAYLRLTDAAQGIDTEILPGVEEVTSEGIDIIFLFRNESDLRRGLKRVRTFFWSVRDVAVVARDIGAISIIPHPFHIGRTGAGQVLSRRGYMNLVHDVDYVEVHNGSALNIRHRMGKSRVTPLFPITTGNLDHTLDLPYSLRGGNDTGWSIGSDAHYPGEQYIVGATHKTPRQGESFFDLLTRRIHFEPHTLRKVSKNTGTNCFNILREFQGVLREGTTKRCKKTIARAHKAVNL